MSAPGAGDAVAMKRLVIGLMAALLVIGVVAAQLWLELRSEREQGRQLLASLPAQESVEQPLPAGTVAASPGASAVAETAGAAAREPAPGQSGGEGASLLANLQDIANNPQAREFVRSMMVMTMSQEYADLAGALGISQEQVDRLINLLADQRIGVGTERASLAQGGASRDPAARAERARLLAEREQANEREVEALLGANYPKWKEYQRGAAERQREQLARQQANTLRAAINTRENPLSDAQFEPLAAALAAEQQRIDQESRGQSAQQQLQRMDADQRRLADVAAVYLNPGQLERYRRHLRQEAEMARAVMGMVGGAQGAQGAQGGAAANTAD